MAKDKKICIMVKDKKTPNSLTFPSTKKMLKPELCAVDEVWISSIRIN